MKKTQTFIRTSMLATSLVLAAGAATAGGVSEPITTPTPVPAPAPPPVPLGNDWTGFYAGGQLGYAWVESDALSEDAEDLTYGVHAGYLYDFGSWVLGGEVDLDGTEVEQDGVEVDAVTRAKLRLGYDAGNILPYLTTGVAQLRTSSDVDAFDGDDTGAFVGLGLDYLLSPAVRLGGEVLRHEFEDYNDSDENIDATTFAARVSFKF